MPYLRRASLTQSLPQMNTVAMQLYVAVKMSNHTADLSHHPKRSLWSSSFIKLIRPVCFYLPVPHANKSQ